MGSSSKLVSYIKEELYVMQLACCIVLSILLKPLPMLSSCSASESGHSDDDQ